MRDPFGIGLIITNLQEVYCTPYGMNRNFCCLYMISDTKRLQTLDQWHIGPRQFTYRVESVDRWVWFSTQLWCAWLGYGWGRFVVELGLQFNLTQTKIECIYDSHFVERSTEARVLWKQSQKTIRAALVNPNKEHENWSVFLFLEVSKINFFAC